MKMQGFGCLSGVLLLVLASPLWAAEPGGVLIDELYYDPLGSDTGYEYIILYNTGADPVDLEGWRIERGGTSFIYGAYTISGVVMPPEEVIVFGGDMMIPVPDVVYNFNFPGGGTSSDGVRIVDAAGTVIDTLIYDSPNSYRLPGDGGFDPYPDEMCAVDVPAGKTLTRDADHTDTDDCSVDFSEGDPLGTYTLEMDALYGGGLLSLNFTIGAPESSTWKLYFILTSPSVQIVPAWSIPLPAIGPPTDLSILLPFPSVGWVGIYTGLFTAEGALAVELVWVNTG